LLSVEGGNPTAHLEKVSKGMVVDRFCGIYGTAEAVPFQNKLKLSH
jgi:hypothetical protein